VPEGLSAAEAATELRRHNHHHSATHEPHVGPLIPIVEALLLSVVTIVTAWAGYSAAKWSTESRLDLAHASTLRVEANRALGTAMESRNFDSSTFNAWFTAYILDNAEKMRIAERRFTPRFKVAFDAWIATDPENNPNGPPGPTYMPEYKQPAKAKFLRLDDQADAAALSGEHAGSVADDYVRITVLLAAVLFLIGIGTTFKVKQVRYGIASVGGLILLSAVVLIAQQPRPR
jgi:hypothetical protein